MELGTINSEGFILLEAIFRGLGTLARKSIPRTNKLGKSLHTVSYIIIVVIFQTQRRRLVGRFIFGMRSRTYAEEAGMQIEVGPQSLV